MQSALQPVKYFSFFALAYKHDRSPFNALRVRYDHAIVHDINLERHERLGRRTSHVFSRIRVVCSAVACTPDFIFFFAILNSTTKVSAHSFKSVKISLGSMNN